ncbi:MAG: class I SAM-dependent methyltransferase [Gammaproteobacteria bacterium]|nr:class I SAM-dependent methyltransferase [Gammaproteobacteria bacterium]
MKEFWEERYSEEDFAYGIEPNVFLASCKEHIPKNCKALAIADGEGRNGVWLAEQGCEVTSVDYSQAGVAKSEALAKERNVSVNALCADLTTWSWPEEEFDIVVSIFAHFPPGVREQIHNNIMKTLKPGGKLIMEAYHPRQLEYKTGGPPAAEMMYSVDTLRDDFQTGKILMLEDLDADVSEGKYHFGQGAVTRLILQKQMK